MTSVVWRPSFFLETTTARCDPSFAPACATRYSASLPDERAGAEWGVSASVCALVPAARDESCCPLGVLPGAGGLSEDDGPQAQRPTLRSNASAAPRSAGRLLDGHSFSVSRGERETHIGGAEAIGRGGVASLREEHEKSSRCRRAAHRRVAEREAILVLG
jgi:hypothetical protein